MSNSISKMREMLDTEKVTEWIKKGAKPTDTAAALIKKAGVEI